MPSYKDLLRLLREGKSPDEIARIMPMRLSHWRRMINGKRFQDALKIEEDLAAVMAAHGIASGVHGAAGRFAELLVSDKPETARKVALAILHEGLKREREETGDPRPSRAGSPRLNPCNPIETARRTRQDWVANQDAE
jgi:hypothetical protein